MNLKDRVRVLQRDFSADDRRDLAAKGQALPDGSYPIPDRDALRRALTLAKSGHGDVPAAMRLIRKRAKELGVEVETTPVTQKIAGTIPVASADGTVVYVPYMDAPLAQDASMGSGVLSDDDSDTQPKVGERNPAQMKKPGRKNLAKDKVDADVQQMACPACGTTLTKDEDGTAMVCPHCETQVTVPGANAKEKPLVRQDDVEESACPQCDDGTMRPKGKKKVCEQCGYTMKVAQDDVEEADGEDDGDGDVDEPFPDTPGKKMANPLAQTAVLQMDEAKRVVTSCVQSPDSETMPATMPGVALIYPKETIQQMAWGFLEDMKNNAIGLQHNEVKQGRIVEPQGETATLVENWITPTDIMFPNGRFIAQGSWIQSYKINDDDVWQAIKDGRIGAASLSSTDVEFEDLD